jgi:hypothetical protein
MIKNAALTLGGGYKSIDHHLGTIKKVSELREGGGKNLEAPSSVNALPVLPR